MVKCCCSHFVCSYKYCIYFAWFTLKCFRGEWKYFLCVVIMRDECLVWLYCSYNQRLCLYLIKRSYLHRSLHHFCFTKHKPYAGRWRPKNAIFICGDLDLDLQTHLSEGPNTSSIWIWHKSTNHLNYFNYSYFYLCNLYRFNFSLLLYTFFSGSRDVSYPNKKTTDWRRQKQNLLQFSAWSNKSWWE